MHIEELDQKVLERTKELEASKKRLEELASTDVLTGLKNRRALFEIGEKLLNLSHRESTPLSVIVFDLDRFKQVNDQYGHALGDQVLIAFADILTHSRKSDVAARIGGEEFVLILPNTKVDEAYKIAEQIRKKAEQITISYTEGKSFNFSVSGGVDLLQKEDEQLNTLIARTDKALYYSKQTGRNKNTIYSESHNMDVT
jgi:diguanylate cyclase (GGDEF)-like protein